MGNWTITIKGHGIHDNGRQDDADAMAAVLVSELRAAGHDVAACTFSLHYGAGQTTERSLEPQVPSVESTQYRVAGVDEHGQRHLVGEGPGKQPIRHVHYPAGLDDPRPYDPNQVQPEEVQ